MKPKNIFFFFILMSAKGFLFGQLPNSINYTVEDGLPSSEIYCIIQDSKGYIWIGTDRGVSRFDGYKFKNYSTENGLTDNTVFDIYEDPLEKIWFITHNGKLCYFKDDKIIKYEWNHVLDSVFPGQKIARSFYSNGRNDVFISYLNRGIIHLKPNGKIQFKDNFQVTSNVRIYFSYVIDEIVLAGSLLKEGKDSKNSFLEIKSSSANLFHEMKNAQNNSDIRCIRRKNGSYITMLSQGIVAWDNTKIKGVYYDLSSTFHNIIEDMDSSLWIGTRRNGVMHIQPNKIPENQNYEFLLDGKTVSSILCDKDRGYWFATLENGIFYIPSIVFRFWNQKDNYGGASSIISGDSSSIFIGYKNGVIEEVRNFTTINTYRISSGSESMDYIQCLYYDKEKQVLWVGTSKYLWKIKKGKKPEMVIDNSCRSIKKGKDDKYWVAGRINLGITATDSITFPSGKDLSIRTDIIYPDQSGSKWFGNSDGLYILKNGKLKKDTCHYLNVRISGISELNDASLVIGTLGNGIILKRKNKNIRISKENGLSGNMVNAVFVEGNEIWVANNGGLDRISFNKEGKYETESFNKNHGLPSLEISQIYKIGGLIWLATSKGAVYFKISEYKRNYRSPEIYLQSIRVNNDPINLDVNELNYNENQFEFHFSGLVYKMRKNVLYKYRLKGASDDWQYTTSTSVRFATVQPGNYVFEVFAQNEDGVWSDKPARFSFTILPPFWRTGWFFSLILLAFLLIGFFIVRQIRQRIKIRNRLFEFQQQALTAQMNPHFIFNSLYSIQSFVLKEDRVSASKYLSKFAQLMRKSLEHSRLRMVPLKDEIILLVSYLDLQKLRYQEKFDYSIEVDNSIDERRVHIPTMLLQPFIENAIIHGVIHRTDDSGKIKIAINKEGNNFICRISDNGIGRKESILIKKEKFNKRSFGITITKERLKIICREHKCKFYLNVEDNESADLQHCGTIVTFSLPYLIKDAEIDTHR